MSGQIDIDDLKEGINKREGDELAYNLNDKDPTEVDFWMSTGCWMLDSITVDGGVGGIPSGKIVELAGEESTGKSFLASHVAGNAINSDDADLVVYFDSEEAQSSEFLEKAGVNLDNLLYVRAKSVEFIFETIEYILDRQENVLFIWDSLALTPHRELKESDWGQRQDISATPRLLAKAFKRVTSPLGQNSSTLLVTNQVRENINTNPYSSEDPLYTPGGRTLRHVYSLRIWLSRRDTRSSYVTNEDDERIGAEVEARIKKSRFGSEEKTCNFDIIWRGNVGIREKQYWLDVLKEECDEFDYSKNGYWTLEVGEYEESGRGEDAFVGSLEKDKEFESQVKNLLNSAVEGEK